MTSRTVLSATPGGTADTSAGKPADGTGYRAEVKALLTAHGANKLSDITDPEELAKLAKEAEVIGSA